MTATPTATPATPAQPESTLGPLCWVRPDTNLAFGPGAIDLRGSGPFATSIVITNHGATKAAFDVLLGLETAGGARYLQRIGFANGQVWQVDGQPSVTLFLAGAVPAGGSVVIPVVVHMTDSWPQAAADANIEVTIVSTRCQERPPTARLTISMRPGEAP